MPVSTISSLRTSHIRHENANSWESRASRRKSSLMYEAPALPAECRARQRLGHDYN
jgi:hypothetical protein